MLMSGWPWVVTPIHGFLTSAHAPMQGGSPLALSFFLLFMLTSIFYHLLTCQEEIHSSRSKLGEMQDERSRLMWQQEVLQAELQLALGAYQPKATIG